jgi:hypothetical protein
VLVARWIGVCFDHAKTLISEATKCSLGALLRQLKEAKDAVEISSALDSVIGHAPDASQGAPKIDFSL